MATTADEAAEQSAHAGMRVPPTPLVGREAEVAAVVARLREPGVRITTLTGPGGVGKTRVALEAATRASDDFADGVWFVPLAEIRDPQLVASAIAGRVGLRTGRRLARDVVREFLEPRELLLVLDSFEHLIEAAEVPADLAATCPALKLLVTSRATLNLSAEHEVPLPPLRAPADAAAARGADIAAFPAVTLFVQRAQAADPFFELTDANAAAVAEICARLNGLPLALELAAARAKLLSPDAILTRLQRRLELLTRGPRDLPARQRTMRGAIEWSYDLLDEIERRVFRTLCVFVAGCTPEAATAICDAAGGPPVDMLDTVASLLDKNMVYRVSGRDGEPRLDMLDTIREYGLDALAAAGELEPVRRAHAGHFVVLAEAGAAELTGPGQVGWIDRLATEHGNLRAALRSSLDARDAATALRLASALGQFWYLRGHLEEGRRWLDEVLESAGGRDDPLRVTALYWACILGYHDGAYARAEAFCEQGLELARRLGDEHGVALSLQGLALIARATGRYDEARAMYHECSATFRRLGDRRELAESTFRLAVLEFFEGNHEAALRAAEEATSLMREVDDSEGCAAVDILRGNVLTATGDDDAAVAVTEQALAQMRAMGTWRYTTRAMQTLGRLAIRRRDYAQARAQIEEATAISLERGEPMYAVVCVLALAQVMLGQGEPAAAVRLLGAAAAGREAFGGAVPAAMREGEDEAIRSARAALGDRRFAAALAKGRAMTLEQALASLPTPSARTDPGDAAGLTARELDVLRAVAQGLSDADIAEALVISRRTVHAHLRSIYRKLDVSSRSAATRYAYEQALVEGRPATVEG